MLECCILRARFHPGDDFRCTDPCAAQGRIDARPQSRLGQTRELALLGVGLGIDPTL